jgi:hypothetical protein
LPSLKQELHDVAYHAGETAGAAAVACRRADGLVIALALNTEFLGYAGLPDDKEVAASMLGAADHLIGYWPTDVNLFPSFGKGKKPEKKKPSKKKAGKK